jgi:phosphoribosylamine---glycine ligase
VVERAIQLSGVPRDRVVLQDLAGAADRRGCAEDRPRAGEPAQQRVEVRGAGPIEVRLRASGRAGDVLMSTIMGRGSPTVRRRGCSSRSSVPGPRTAAKGPASGCRWCGRSPASTEATAGSRTVQGAGLGSASPSPITCLGGRGRGPAPGSRRWARRVRARGRPDLRSGPGRSWRGASCGTQGPRDRWRRPGARPRLAARRLRLGRPVASAPGNPGTAELGPTYDLDATDPVAVADLAEGLGSDLVVVGPEAPLVAGAVDELGRRGLAAFGPVGAAAEIEGSKAFAKDVMVAAGAPTAGTSPPPTARRPTRRSSGSRRPTSSRPTGSPPARACGSATPSTRPATRSTTRWSGGSSVRPARTWSSRSSSTVPSAASSGSATARTWCCSPRPRTTSGRSTATRGSTPAGWAPTRRCPGSGWTRSPTSRTWCSGRSCASSPGRGTPYRGCSTRGWSTPPTVRSCSSSTPGSAIRRPRSSCRDWPATSASCCGRRPPGPSRTSRCAGTTRRWSPSCSPAAATPAATRRAPDRRRRGGGPPAGHVQVFHAGTRREADGRLVTAGGRVLNVTARGTDVADARARAYDAVGRIRWEGAHHRTDVAAGV